MLPWDAALHKLCHLCHLFHWDQSPHTRPVRQGTVHHISPGNIHWHQSCKKSQRKFLDHKDNVWFHLSSKGWSKNCGVVSKDIPVKCFPRNWFIIFGSCMQGDSVQMNIGTFHTCLTHIWEITLNRLILNRFLYLTFNLSQPNLLIGDTCLAEMFQLFVRSPVCHSVTYVTVISPPVHFDIPIKWCWCHWWCILESSLLSVHWHIS